MVAWLDVCIVGWVGGWLCVRLVDWLCGWLSAWVDVCVCAGLEVWLVGWQQHRCRDWCRQAQAAGQFGSCKEFHAYSLLKDVAKKNLFL